jgi:cobalt-zinc-cadmium efflux system membrane fusion protein
MRGRFGIAVVAVVVAGLIGVVGAGDEHDHHEEHGDEGSTFAVDDFARRGVRVATAAAGTVDLGVDLPGEVRTDADRIAHLAPRFPGLVREVRKRIGDPVRAGEVLAVVESETLATFELKAAFDGVVIDRHVVPGEAVSRETPAFIVADLSSVWVDVHVYQSALAELRIGQPVRIVAPGGLGQAEGTISYIAPVVDQATRSARARIVLANPAGTWRPGLFVNVTVLTPVDAPVVVPTEAIHRLDGATVVFVVDHDRFTPRPVTVGRTGRTRAAIVAGLAPGERYAEAGSFLVTAELAKSDAGHEH